MADDKTKQRSNRGDQNDAAEREQERIRSISSDDEFEDTDELDEDENEDANEDEGSTF